MQKGFKKELSTVTGIALVTVLVLVIGQQLGFDPLSETNLSGAVITIVPCSPSSVSGTRNVTQILGWSRVEIRGSTASERAAFKSSVQSSFLANVKSRGHQDCQGTTVPNCPSPCFNKDNTRVNTPANPPTPSLMAHPADDNYQGARPYSQCIADASVVSTPMSGGSASSSIFECIGAYVNFTCTSKVDCVRSVPVP